MRSILLILLFVYADVMAFENLKDSDAEKAKTAYLQAVDNVRNGWESIQNNQKIEFRKVVKPDSDARQDRQVVIWLNGDGEEVSADENQQEQEDNNLNWQHNILVDPSRFPSAPKLLRQTDKAWIFEMPVNIGVEAPAEQDIDKSRIDERVNQSLIGELSVSKIQPRILAQKIYAVKPFRPQSMVKVSKFHVRIEYREAWTDGPWVTHSVSREVEGKYAMFFSVEEFNSTRYSEFRLLK